MASNSAAETSVNQIAANLINRTMREINIFCEITIMGTSGKYVVI